MRKQPAKEVSDILEPVLVLLRDNRSKFFSAKEIADKLGVPGKTIMEAIGGLSAWGYRFESNARAQFRFLSAPDTFFPFEIHYGLKTKYIARRISPYYSIVSTNETAFRLAEKGAPEGTMVIAEKQTGGRGRMGRSWHSPPKLGLWMSLVLRPKIAPSAAPSLSILSALTLSEVIRAKYKLQSMIKWPNDCLIDNRKVSGILTELSAEPDKTEFVIVGVGINVNLTSKDFPRSLRSAATSLREELGEKVNRVDLLRAFLERFEINYDLFKAKGLKAFLGKIKKHSLMLGRKIKLKVGQKIIQAVAYDIDSDGALLARHRREILRVTAGEVTIIDSAS